MGFLLLAALALVVACWWAFSRRRRTHFTLMPAGALSTVVLPRRQTARTRAALAAATATLR